MSRYVITGASGHIGNNLVRLINRREPESEVVVLSRREIDRELRGTVCGQVIGSLEDADFLRSVLQKGDIVVHLAGLIDLSDRRVEEMERINVGMTKLICDMCIEIGTARFIYVGSVDGIAKNEQASCIAEPEVYDAERVAGNYGKSKARAMQYVLERIHGQTACPMAMVLPSAVIGPHDYKPSAVGGVLARVLRGGAEIGIRGGYDFVSVEDVCEAILTLCHNDLRDHYILCGGSMTVLELYGLVNRTMGYRRRPILIPKWVIYPFLPFVKVLNRNTLKALCDPHSYSCEKARAALGYQPRSAEAAVLDALQWFLERKNG